jgi:hypothetical protein
MGMTMIVWIVDAGILPTAVDDSIKGASISVGTAPSGTIFDISRDVWLRVLTAVRLVVSGFALIYLVLIWAYMIVFSETEDRIKSQKKQIGYALIGFLFLNMPGLVYTIFFWSFGVDPTISSSSIWSGLALELWNNDSLTWRNGFVPMITSFFEVFIFGAAIVMFTWWFFRMILSWGDEEVQKKGKNRIIYGVLALVFLWFVKVWSGVISKGDFFGEFATVGRKLLWLAVYFAAPVVIFFLVLGSYYYITSSWDEERTKKAKSIFINTLIAALILLWAYSFLSDLVSFTL